MNKSRLATLLYNRIFSIKAGSKLSFTKEEFDKYINTIYDINSLERFSTQYQNHLLSDFEIPVCLKELILPDSVTLTCDRRDIDFLARPEKDENSEILMFADFNNMSQDIYAAMRKPVELISLEEARRPISLAGDDMIRRFTYNDMAIDDTPDVYHIPLNIQFKDPGRFVYSEDDCISEFWRERFKPQK